MWKMGKFLDMIHSICINGVTLSVYSIQSIKVDHFLSFVKRLELCWIAFVSK